MPQDINGTVACMMGRLVLQKSLVPEEFLKLIREK